ncbi:MAG: ParB/RepB/Spo0J family partition protein [Holosporales bacterium]|jgi:ParB family chromosome partitioning protein|nr:ParB/RepB/Spo0J family partition protein [Holosporales bacterium]
MPKTLGKGLAELFRDTSNADMHKGDNSLKNNGTVMMVRTELLASSRFQPRKNFDDEALESLSQSIKEKGILQPIIVRKIDSSESCQIIAGERRWRAAQRAGLAEVPVIFNNLSDSQMLESALLENIQREDLNPIEEAEGYNQLMIEFKYTQEQISKFSGKSRPHIANMLRLLTLPASIKTYLTDGKLSFGHARALIGNQNAENIAKKIIANDLNVRQTERLTKNTEKQARPTSKKADPEITELQSRLENLLNTETKINFSSPKGNGYIQIKFDSLSMLDSIMCKLSK